MQILQYKKTIGITLILLAAAGVGYAAFGDTLGGDIRLGGDQASSSAAVSASAKKADTNAGKADTKTEAGSAGAEPSQPTRRAQADTPEPIQSDVAKIQSRLTEKYVNKTLGFGFGHPPGYSASTFSSDPESTTLLLQHPDKRASLQVVVTQLDEPINLTADYIRQELPEYPVNNPEPVRLGGKKRGVVFASQNEKFGQSREIWFTRNQVLYQISSYKAFDPFVKAVFSSFTLL